MKGAVDIYVVWLFPSTVCMFASHNWLRGGAAIVCRRTYEQKEPF